MKDQKLNNLVLDFPEGYVPISEVCSLCVHLLEWNEIPGCKAFKKIPLEIWKGKNKHNKPYPGDNGIQFEFRK